MSENETQEQSTQVQPEETKASTDTQKDVSLAAGLEKAVGGSDAAGPEAARTKETTITKRIRKKGDLFTGRRKNSTARVKVVDGSGKFLVNKKPIDEYFGREFLRHVAMRPLVVLEKTQNYDVYVNVTGGGNTGQAGAISLGLARCLDVIEPQSHKTLRKEGLLTRDPRMVERKKYGLHKARRASQFSKR